MIDGALLLDKPLGLTSNAALQKAKRLFGADKAGHAGTLDPLASGLLMVLFGEATKFAGPLLDADKEYLATVKLGQRTSSGTRIPPSYRNCLPRNRHDPLSPIKITSVSSRMPSRFSRSKTSPV